MSSDEYVVFDLETTGLSVSSERLVTFGVLRKTEHSGVESKILRTTARQKQGETPAEMVDPKEEKQAIQDAIQFISETSDNAPVYTYNGDTFDWPFLITRAYELFDDYGGTVDQLFQWKENRGHDLIKSHGTYPSGAVKKLEQVLREHGIQHKGGVGGGKVPEYFANGRIKEIIDYSMEDVVTTAALVEKINNGQPQPVLEKRTL